jgi:predicted transglutaminase-like cysteine proteinase
MRGHRGILKLAAAAATMVVGLGAANAQAIDFTNEAFAPIVGPTSIPIGHAEFCAKNRAECAANAQVRDAVELNEALWDQLIGTNNRMNTEIVPITDEEHYKVGELWTYPDADGSGDCEDIALAKRQALILEGWDPSTLLMAVVRERNGAGHAVLMVRTDRGDLVLDNQVGAVKLWSETNYQFIKRQSQENAGQWVLIDDSRSVVVTTASN